ncbi:MAG: hypothetical protein D6769_02925 [Methanobacteriota archaeon]|nr:MAG: hypothetical protein D6769_02925 [Euryarchaeota archaeon]
MRGEELGEIEKERVHVKVAGKSYSLAELEKILEIISFPYYLDSERLEEYEEKRQRMLSKAGKVAKKYPELKEVIDMVKKVGTLNAMGWARSASRKLEDPSTQFGIEFERVKEQLSKCLDFMERVGNDLESWERAYYMYVGAGVDLDFWEIEERIKKKKSREWKIVKEWYAWLRKNIHTWPVTKAFEELVKAVEEGDKSKTGKIIRSFEILKVLESTRKKADELEVKEELKKGWKVTIERYGGFRKKRHEFIGRR